MLVEASGHLIDAGTLSRALDAVTGEEAWRVDNCAVSSPRVVGDVVYIGTCRDSVDAIDRATGELLFHQTDPRIGLIRSDQQVERA